MNSELIQAAQTSPDARRQLVLNVFRHSIAAAAVSSEHVRILSRSFIQDASLTRDEAELLFCIDAGVAHKCPEWTEFLVEILTDYTVWQSRPTGVLSEDLGEWLLTKADHSANVSALAVLVNIVAEADRVPSWFVAAVRGRVARGWPGVQEALSAHLARAA
eukprot:gene15606-15755_t